MDYIPKNIDIPAFEDALWNKREYQLNQKLIAVKEADAYFRGYEAAIMEVKGMLHCSNYENDDKDAESFTEGVNAAFYELCKELDVGSQDVREINTSVDEKAAILAERITSVLTDRIKHA